MRVGALPDRSQLSRAGAAASPASAAVRRRWPAPPSCAAAAIAVTVFDNRPLPGGLNTYGVAEYKLRPADSLREVELIRSLGVEFRQAEIGGAASLDDTGKGIRSPSSSGVGLGAMERLGIPGEDLPGVIDALRFIARYKTVARFRSGPARGRDRRRQHGHRRRQRRAAAGRRRGPHLLPPHRKGNAGFRFRVRAFQSGRRAFHWLAQPVEIVDGRAAA